VFLVICISLDPCADVLVSAVDPQAAKLAAGRKHIAAQPPEKLRLAVSRAGKYMRLSRRKISG